MLSPWREPRRRRAAWFGLILAVLFAHALFGLRVLSSVIGWNSPAEPKRIEITLTRQVTPTAPPPAAAVAPPAPAPARRAPRVVRVARASSAAEAASAPEEAAASQSRASLVDQALALAGEMETAQRAKEAAESASAAQARAAELAASAATLASATASAAARNVDPVAGAARRPFAWPPSTRLTYTLTGLYRNGPLYGKASVEWRRVGTHYQVQFDIHVAPFFDQHMFSDGEITDAGLSPRHYDEVFELPLVAPRVRKIEFSDDEVTLANGTRVIRLPRTQDGASQFVQFVWMFSTQPGLLRPGNVIDIPLALNSNLRRWHYRVEGVETLDLASGRLDAVHLKPVLDGPRRPNEYPFEIWTAPTLQYLPVRILVPIDDKNFADLSLDALPMQAAPAPEEATSQPQEP